MNDDKSYLGKLFDFYFSPHWYTIFKIFFLLIFGYFIIFYCYNAVFVVKFIWYTVTASKQMFGLSYLFWGIIFTFCLAGQIFVSIYSLTIPYEIWENKWRLDRKLITTALISMCAILIIVLMDYVLVHASQQGPIVDFVAKNSLRLLAK
jgi:hypothetical protein